MPRLLKRIDFYKAQRSEKRGVLWLASYPVRCDWPNASSVVLSKVPDRDTIRYWMINEALGEECEAMIIEAITYVSVERVNNDQSALFNNPLNSAQI